MPDIEALTEGIRSALAASGLTESLASVVSREPNIYARSGVDEIVRCRLRDGREVQIVCKYGSVKGEPSADVEYEVAFYQKVLVPWAVSTAKFLGSFVDASSGRTCLCVEYVDDSTALSHLWDKSLIRAAAGWIGRFHAMADERIAEGLPTFLKRFDMDLYVRRARGALAAAGDLSTRTWLSALVDRFEPFIAPFFETRTTVVHGDYYLHNLLVRDGTLIPIDWGMAGIDLGEADLAALLDGVDEDTSRRSEMEYQCARWPGGSPDFDRAITAARLCLYFQNLASPGESATEAVSEAYSRRLRALAERLELI